MVEQILGYNVVLDIREDYGIVHITDISIFVFSLIAISYLLAPGRTTTERTLPTRPHLV